MIVLVPIVAVVTIMSWVMQAHTVSQSVPAVPVEEVDIPANAASSDDGSIRGTEEAPTRGGRDAVREHLGI